VVVVGVGVRQVTELLVQRLHLLLLLPLLPLLLPSLLLQQQHPMLSCLATPQRHPRNTCATNPSYALANTSQSWLASSDLCLTLSSSYTTTSSAASSSSSPVPHVQQGDK